ncbi:MAG: hypothetical protein HZA83_02725, partial [Thaumarchaeota archaeon]|nr:hypothetical protein [Nitrososphaerota archaeon]
MGSQKVVINLQGDLKSFSSDGTIKIAETNAQINLHAFKDIYTFTITRDGELQLKPRGANKYYAIQGTITKSENGQLRVLGDGRFNGAATKNVYALYIDEQGRTRATAEQFGSLKFEGRAHIIYEQKDNKEYYSLNQAQLKGKDYELTGLLFVENGKSYTPQGKVLTITPYLTKDKAKTASLLSDTGYIVKAQHDNVEVDLDNPWKYAVKDFLASLTNGKDKDEKNRVRFSEQRLPLLESKTKEPDEPADYRFEADTATVITAEAAAKDGMIDKFMKLPSRGYYKLNDQPAEDSAEFNTITAIQEIVGLPAQNGVYDIYTKEAVREWQKNYNTQHGYTSENEAYLTPDGFWGKATRTSYYRELPRDEKLIIRQEVPEIAIEPKGARVAFENTNNGVKINLDTGLADIELAGLRFRSEGEIQGVEGLKERLQQRLKTPVTVSIAVDEEGNLIQQDELVVFDKDYQYKSLGKKVLEGEVDLSCAFTGVVRTAEVACATLVTEYANLEAGGRYVTYNFKKDGKQERMTRVQATGEGGSAWQMAGNVIKAGGKSLFWVKDQGLSEDTPVVYDYGQFEEGDIIGLYNINSNYLDKAKEQGKLGRDYTHVVKVVGKETNVYQPGQGKDLKTYLQQELEITTPRILASYLVFIEDQRDNNMLKRAYLTSEGNYYFEDQLDEYRTPKQGAQPITLAADTSVMVDKSIITQLYHGQIITGDLGQFLERN